MQEKVQVVSPHLGVGDLGSFGRRLLGLFLGRRLGVGDRKVTATSVALAVEVHTT